MHEFLSFQILSSIIVEFSENQIVIYVEIDELIIAQTIGHYIFRDYFVFHQQKRRFVFLFDEPNTFSFGIPAICTESRTDLCLQFVFQQITCLWLLHSSYQLLWFVQNERNRKKKDSRKIRQRPNVTACVRHGRSTSGIVFILVYFWSNVMAIDGNITQQKKETFDQAKAKRGLGNHWD